MATFFIALFFPFLTYCILPSYMHSISPPQTISGPQSTLTIERGHCCTASRGHLKLDDNNGLAITTEKTNSTFHTVWPIEGFYVAISNVFMFNAVSLHFL